jgi:hypothetical protein
MPFAPPLSSNPRGSNSMTHQESATSDRTIDASPTAEYPGVQVSILGHLVVTVEHLPPVNPPVDSGGYSIRVWHPLHPDEPVFIFHTKEKIESA